MGYSMTADEVAYWQDQAALLDPDAYEYTFADSDSEVVTASERWYLVNGWFLDGGSGTFWYHRPADVNRALLLSEGTTIATGAAPSTNVAFKYVCKPSLVTGSDARYTTDPRGLYFDRIMQLGTLAQYTIGVTNTGSGTSSAAFPSDFTNGMMLHTSAHDVAWLILLESGGAGGLNTHNEISDTDRIRWAEPTLCPFKRTTFPDVAVRGVSQSEGRGQLTYVKLPGGW